MKVRPFKPQDSAELARIVGANEWGFPDPSHPACVDVLVVEEEGRIVGAIAAVSVAEVFLALDRSDQSAPARRLERAAALIEAGCRVLYQQGIRIAYTPVPRELAGWFRKLQRFFGIKEETRLMGHINLKERFEWATR